MDYSKKRSGQVESASSDDLRMMRHYILSNCDEVIPWIEYGSSEIVFYFVDCICN